MVKSCNKWTADLDSALEPPFQLEQRFPGSWEIMRLLYFAAVFATASWLITLLWRKLVAVRQVGVIVESPERTAQVNALERALRAEDGEPDTSANDDQELS